MPARASANSDSTLNPDPNPDPATGLVRRFSEQWQQRNPDDKLQRALGAKVAFDQAEDQQRLHSLPSTKDVFVRSDEAALASARSRLQEAWKKFQNKLPKDQRMALNDKDPNLEYLFQSVNDAAQSWELNSTATSSGKAKVKFRTLCQHLENHKTMFSVFPKEDKYFSIFAGSLTTIVRAAVNHSEITEQVGLALGDLGEDIDFWHRHKDEINKEKLRRFIIEFYVTVFEFFTEVFVQWSRSSLTRFWTSLSNKAMADLFTSKRAQIRNIQERLQREIDADSRRKTNQFQDQSSEFQGNAARRLFRIEGSMDRMQGSVEKMEDFLHRLQGPRGIQFFTNYIEAVLGHDAQKLLTEHTLGRIEAVRPRSSPSDEEHTTRYQTPRSKRPAEVAIRTDNGSGTTTRDLISDLVPLKTRLAQHLQAVSSTASYISRLNMDASVQRRILAWASNPASEVLWVEGPSAIARPSQNTATALILTAILRRTDVKYVQYFAGVVRQPDRAFDYKQSLLEMVLCMIMQLIMIATETLAVDLSFLQPHLESLNDCTISFDNALRLLRRTRLQITDTIAFVIDYLQDLEDRDDHQYMEYMLQTLGELCSMCEDVSMESPANCATKICFTTDGYMTALGVAAAEDLLSKVTYSCEADDRMADDIQGFM